MCNYAPLCLWFLPVTCQFSAVHLPHLLAPQLHNNNLTNSCSPRASQISAHNSRPRHLVQYLCVVIIVTCTTAVIVTCATRFRSETIELATLCHAEVRQLENRSICQSIHATVANCLHYHLSLLHYLRNIDRNNMTAR